MTDTTGVAIFGADTIFKGRVRRARIVEVLGVIEGEISAAHVVVRPGGRFLGRMIARSAEVEGDVRGEVFVKELIRIGDGGRLAGEIQYGAISMSPGAELDADLRNVPPTLAGDGEISVHKGRAAILTRDDLRAVDPDDAPQDLKFSVSKTAGGHIAVRTAPDIAVTTFTQADLNAGKVLFKHDGSDGRTGGFAVQVSDDDGATSGTPQTINVTVIDLPDRRAGL